MNALRQTPLVSAPQTVREIAVVDDDALFLATFAANLRAGGWRVSTFTSTKAILAAWFEGLRPVTILVEARAAAREHGALPRALRSIGYAGPLVLLTPEEPDSADHGADQGTPWIAKTLPPVTILRALARAVDDAAGAERISLGALELDPVAGQALWHGRAVALGRCELAIAALLAQRAGVTVSYRELFQAMHADLFASGTTTENYRMMSRAAVERLRQKFLSADARFDAIEHAAGIGYRWRV